MRAWLTKWIRRTALLLAVIVVGLLAMRIYDTPPLEPWHTYLPHELTAKITPIGPIISRPKTKFSQM